MVRELQIWAKLNHKNVLSLLGYTVDGGLYYLSLITEWMSNGTAMQYIRAKGESVDLLYMVRHILMLVHHDLELCLFSWAYRYTVSQQALSTFTRETSYTPT